MKIIPAIDLMGGKVVRLTRGDPEAVTVYNHFGDPVTVARRWEDEGANAIHIIDLDAALNRGNNLQEIERIVRATHIPIQVGGGIRTTALAQNLLNQRITRIIVASLAFTQQSALTTLLNDFGRERIVVALDHREGRVMVSGWRDVTELSVGESLQRFRSLGVIFFLVTSITQDGTLKGPDSDSLTLACNTPGVKIIAAGGVSSVEDLVVLKRIGVWGVVIGKALYEDAIMIKEALDVARGG